MTQKQAKEAVRRKYANAFVWHMPCSPLFYIVPWDKAIGSIGAGRTAGRAWLNAAECMK